LADGRALPSHLGNDRRENKEKEEIQARHRGCHSHDGNGVVVEHGGNIFRGEFVSRVADEEACFANGTVTDDNTSIGVELALLHAVQLDGQGQAARRLGAGVLDSGTHDCNQSIARGRID